MAGDRDEWLAMRTALYGADPSLAREIDQHLAERSTLTVLAAEHPPGSLCGFIELGERAYAEGCRTSPVAYVEGLHVEPEFHRGGVGRALLQAACAAARARGLSEIASDALITNEASIAFHLAQGFAEVERIVCFRKALD